MKIFRWKKCSLLLILIIPLGIFFSPTSINAEIQANAAVFWTPLNPEVGDVVTIQYNTTAGSLDSSISTLYLQWAFDFLGNYDPNLDRITQGQDQKQGCSFHGESMT